MPKIGENKVRRKSVFFSMMTVVLFLLFVGSVNAQGLPFSASLTVTVRPENPRPGDVVSIDLQSFSTDLNGATISWIVGGTVVKSGLGEKSFSTTAPEIGDIKRVQARIFTSEGTSHLETIDIRPAIVDLLWEANTYIHPFYKGKRLHSAGGDLKIVAIPNVISGGIKIPNRNLIFRWKRDNVVLGSKSGTGRNVLEISGSRLGKTENISVEVTTLDSRVSARGFTNIKVSRPKTLIYENNPLLGVVFEKSVTGAYDLVEREVKLEAYPLFFSVNSRFSDDLSYEWRVTGDDSSTDSNITLRRGEGSGSASVSVAVKNLIHILQSGRRSLTVKFSGNDQE